MGGKQMKLYFYELSKSGNIEQTKIEVVETAKLFKPADGNRLLPFNCLSQIRKSEMNHILFDEFTHTYHYFSDHEAWTEAFNEFISAHEAKKAEYLDLAKQEDKIIDNIRKLMED